MPVATKKRKVSSRGRKPNSKVSIRGFFRLHIVEEGPDGNPRIAGDSGWIENTITNAGFQQGIVSCLGAIAGSSQITFAAIGTGTAPGAAATTLNGEITDVAGMRMAVTPTVVSTKTLQFAATLNSGVATTTYTIQNVGLFQTSTTNAGSIYAGQTYSTSQLQSNQGVNLTYQLRFS